MSKISQIRRRLANRTSKGPWSFYHHGSQGLDDCVVEGTTITIPFCKEGDAEFISNTPTDIEYLLNFIELLRHAGESGNDVCDGCENEINIHICHCGDYMETHSNQSGHSGVPMGCTCYMERQ